jgi:Na+/melibiose symporter-like transporter
MSSDIKERTSITSIRFVAATIAQFVVQGLTLPLVRKFSAGGSIGHGWFCTVSIFAVIGFIFLIIAFLSARERITPPPSQKTNIRQDLKDVAADMVHEIQIHGSALGLCAVSER